MARVVWERFGRIEMLVVEIKRKSSLFDKGRPSTPLFLPRMAFEPDVFYRKVPIIIVLLPTSTLRRTAHPSCLVTGRIHRDGSLRADLI
jgi:hypothetical protein